MASLQNGVYTASLTPLTASYEPNIQVLVNHVQWLLGQGSDGVALLGSTGEANSLTLKQRLNLIENATKELPSEKLMIGTGSCSLVDAIELTQASVDAGVNTVLVLPPFYYKNQNDQSVLRYFAELISAINNPDLRIIFYNFPQLTGYKFSQEILKELKQRFGDIAAGIKDSSGDWENMKKIIDNINDFKVFSGTEKYLLDILQVGGAGCISASLNLTSANSQKVFQAWKNKTADNAEKFQHELTTLRSILESQPFVSGIKSLFAHHTKSSLWNNMLPPFAPSSIAEVETITAQLKAAGLDLEKLDFS